MTDITLEQRARDILQDEYQRTHAANPKCNLDEATWGLAHRAVTQALRLSAGADWVMVPREPTPEMLDAGWAEGAKWCEAGAPDFAAAWAAMLAAAPRHETGEFRPCQCHTQRDKDLCLHKRECSVVTAQQEKSP